MPRDRGLADDQVDIASVAAGYLRYSASLHTEAGRKRRSDPETDPDRRAFDLVYEILRVGGPADLAWDLVLELVCQSPDDELGNTAAGPLEDLVKRHGEELVDRIEAEAKRDERFKWALGVVWLMESTLPPNVLRRVYHASGHRLKVAEWLDRARKDDA
jgi:hypothetical protein